MYYFEINVGGPEVIKFLEQIPTTKDDFAVMVFPDKCIICTSHQRIANHFILNSNYKQIELTENEIFNIQSELNHWIIGNPDQLPYNVRK